MKNVERPNSLTLDGIPGQVKKGPVRMSRKDELARIKEELKQDGAGNYFEIVCESEKQAESYKEGGVYQQIRNQGLGVRTDGKSVLLFLQPKKHPRLKSGNGRGDGEGYESGVSHDPNMDIHGKHF